MADDLAGPPPEPTRPSEAPPILVYLDVDDEITTAAARIRLAGRDRIALVLPYGSRLATSRINFRLLAREAIERGKLIEVICADASARALAQAAGLPVYPSVAAFEGRVAATGSSSVAAPVEAGATAATTAGAAADGAAGAGVALPSAGDDVEEGSRTRVLNTPRRSSPRVPIVGPPRPPMRPRLALLLGVAVVVLVLVGGILAVEVLPTATVTLHPRSEVIGPIEFTVEARTDVAAPDTDSLVVPAQRVSFELQASDTFTATGVKLIDTKATGNVKFSNFDTGGANQVDAGSIVKTPSGIEFVTLATVILPNATIEFPFTIIPSTSTVGVQAVVAGPVGNVGNNTITVVPKGENKRLLQVTNVEATSGGEQRQATEVSEQDVQAATAAIEAALATQLVEQVAAGTGVPAGLTIFPTTGAPGEPSWAVDPATFVGTEVASFDLAATAQGTALGVDRSQVQAIAQARLVSRVMTSWTLMPDAAITVGEPTVIGEFINFPVSVRGTQVHDVDAPMLAAEIRGLAVAEARGRLDDYGDVEITVWPDWVTTIPTSPERITFTLGAPQPSVAP